MKKMIVGAALVAAGVVVTAQAGVEPSAPRPEVSYECGLVGIVEQQGAASKLMSMGGACLPVNGDAEQLHYYLCGLFSDYHPYYDHLSGKFGCPSMT